MKLFLLFHVFGALILFEPQKIRKKIKFNRFALIIGSLGPDLIDKPLSLFNSQLSGRGIGHAPLILFLLSLMVFMIEKTFVNEPKYIAKSFTIGCFIHLLLDLPNLPWLYPFKEYDFGYVDDKLNLWWNTLFADPTVSITESIGLIGLIVLAYINKIIFHEKILDINNLKNYLNNQKVSQYRKREKGKNYMKEDQSNQNPHKKRIKR